MISLRGAKLTMHNRQKNGLEPTGRFEGAAERGYMGIAKGLPGAPAAAPERRSKAP